ncbi:MAG: hypothetical protein LBJ00_00255 [Planctomycetaceae bacterium]|nr:hypothetical protein [Planctomycetaceae bacterium]
MQNSFSTLAAATPNDQIYRLRHTIPYSYSSCSAVSSVLIPKNENRI